MEAPVPEHPTNPQQLNMALRRVTDMFPSTSFAADISLGPEASALQREHRQNSRLVTIVDERVSDLVNQAHITTQFKSFIRARFIDWYAMGISPDIKEEILASEFFFLDSEHPQSGGIFDPTLAKKFDKTALIRTMMAVNRRVETFKKTFGEEEATEAAINETFPGQLGNIDAWKKEFKDVYNEDVDG